MSDEFAVDHTKIPDPYSVPLSELGRLGQKARFVHDQIELDLRPS